MADRAIEIWPSICKLVEFWERLPPSKRPKSKSFLNVQEAVKDSLNLLKLDFFSFIGSLVEPYLRAYQTDRPMIPFMCNDLEKLSENLLKLFINLLNRKLLINVHHLNSQKKLMLEKKRKFAEEKNFKNWVLGRNTTFIVV